MKRKIKIFINLIVIAISISGCSCKKEKSDYMIIQESLDNSVNNFKSANISLKILEEETVIYLKEMKVIKIEAGSNYTSKVKELNDDLYSSSLYKETTSNGTLNTKETLDLFASKEQFREDKITNLTRNETIEFTISKENLIEVFDLTQTDINRISNEGIKVVMTLEDTFIKEYQYSYLTNNNLEVIITTTFIF